MTILHTALTAEPASILYIVTGAVGFVFAGIRKSSATGKTSSTAMLFCRKTTRTMLKSLNLL